MIYVFLADGFEEIEALTPVDYLRRGGHEVMTVGITGKTVTSSHKIPITADILSKEVKLDESLEAIILPGGMPGTLNLEKSVTVQEAIDFCHDTGKLICAICAAPSILGHKGLLKGKNAICHPGFETELYGAVLSDKYAVTDGSIITAKGAGSASEFSFEIITYLYGKKESDEMRSKVQLCY